jgi:hypothetical protein
MPYVPARSIRRRRGLGLNCPGDIGCPGNLMQGSVTQDDSGPSIAWTDCPDGSTVPASVGCPSYGQTISTLLNDNAGKIAIGAGLFFAVVLLMKGGR